MTDQLTRALHDATDGLESRLDPATVWRQGRARRRRTAAATVGLAAASVAAVAAISAGLAGTETSPAPQRPASSDVPEIDDQATVGLVTQDHLLPMTDPADWTDLPAYPVDLGHWLSPERPTPLAEDPVTRAATALQYDLGGGEANVVVIGEDGRWRWIDVSGLDLDGGDDAVLGLHRGSLSPDGTRLALGVTAGVVMVDLTTATTTTYDVPGLVERWGTAAGRHLFWSSDGAAILLSQGYWASSRSGSFAYPEGWRIDVSNGAVSRVPYDPEHAARFDDGRVIADLWSERTGHVWAHFSAEGARSELDISTDLLGVLNEPTAHRDLFVARRELTARFPDRGWDRGGFVAMDDEGEVVSMLPVKRVDLNGGGGRVVGWVDETVVVVAMPGPGGNPYRSLAWDVNSGQLWRGPDLPADSVVSLVPSH